MQRQAHPWVVFVGLHPRLVLVAAVLKPAHTQGGRLLLAGFPASYLLDYLARAASLLPLCTQCARSVCSWLKAAVLKPERQQ